MSTTEKSPISSALTDVRRAPFGRPSTPEVLVRLRSSGAKVVAGFNSSL